ncbi:1624_t:CDS:2 [Ambispora leptoticha]|uniref:1624_t:CDS:1 n=1 Tax=Ambispora leptoticha TaxID=144679 RepID=A0A9N9BI33_9GLOM|nr:1624_t:CDS:2 [Ambispora leptoticha]
MASSSNNVNNRKSSTDAAKAARNQRNGIKRLEEIRLNLNIELSNVKQQLENKKNDEKNWFELKAQLEQRIEDYKKMIEYLKDLMISVLVRSNRNGINFGPNPVFAIEDNDNSNNYNQSQFHNNTVFDFNNLSSHVDLNTLNQIFAIENNNNYNQSQNPIHNNLKSSTDAAKAARNQRNGIKRLEEIRLNLNIELSNVKQQLENKKNDEKNWFELKAQLEQRIEDYKKMIEYLKDLMISVLVRSNRNGINFGPNPVFAIEDNDNTHLTPTSNRISTSLFTVGIKISTHDAGFVHGDLRDINILTDDGVRHISHNVKSFFKVYRSHFGCPANFDT